MPRGGRRAGTPGRAYPQRTDMQQPAKLPVKVGPSAVYGQGEQLRKAQEAVPMGGNPTQAPPPQPAKPMLMPGDLPPLTAPTDRPGEPLTAGMDSGPGQGSDVLMQPRVPNTRPHAVSQVIAELSGGDIAGDMAYLYQWAAQRGM